ncbi:MAG TPA: glycosyltransferase [Planctomycetota bacterium]|nr:glycosyltransferase [Planctomycetota bacterium]
MTSLDPSSPLRRLAVVNQRAGGGATAVALDLAARARAAGFDVELFPNDAAADGPALLRELESFRPDVVHAHCFYNDYPPAVLRALGERTPTVFTLHDVYVVNQYGPECWECYRNALCWACPAVPAPKRWYPNYRVRSRVQRAQAFRGLRATVVYPSAWMRRRVARTALFDLPWRVIPYGVDAATFRPREDARRVLGLDDRPTLLMAGNMYSPHDDRKGHGTLFEAFEHIVRLALPDARLFVAGVVHGLTPPEGCTLLGELGADALATWYAAADVVAAPSLGDNLPLAVLEAMATGKPVVASRVGGIPEEVEDGVTGFLVAPRDAIGLGLKCADLLRDRALAARLGAAARARAVEKFSPEAAWTAHLELYRSVTGGRRVTRAGAAAP